MAALPRGSRLMKTHERRTLAVIRSVVEPWGFVVTVVEGGKHTAAVVEGHGLRAKFPVSGSPRDPDAQLNQARQQVRAWLDANGLCSGRGRVGERKPRKTKRTRSTLMRIEVAIEPTSGPARDPWAVLRGMTNG